MCGRYFFKLEDSFHNHQILREKINSMDLGDFQEGEVCPSQNALVLVQMYNKILPSIKKWGILGYKGNLLINARSEGIEEKITFRPMLEQRCVILANGFYEWVKEGKSKQKFAVTVHKQDMIYLAGIYNNDHQFVIVTGASQKDMCKVHDRTPIIMDEASMKEYLNGSYPFLVNNDNLCFENLDKKEKTI